MVRERRDACRDEEGKKENTRKRIKMTEAVKDIWDG